MIAVRRTQAQYGGGRTWKPGHSQANWRATVPTLGTGLPALEVPLLLACIYMKYVWYDASDARSCVYARMHARSCVYALCACMLYVRVCSHACSLAFLHARMLARSLARTPCRSGHILLRAAKAWPQYLWPLLPASSARILLSLGSRAKGCRGGGGGKGRRGEGRT